MKLPSAGPQPKHVGLLTDGDGGGQGCAEALRASGYTVTELQATPGLASRLEALQPDVVFNALSARLGSRGRVQGLLEVLGIPYTQSGVLASALAGDRHQAKIMFRAAGLPVTDHLIVDRAVAARAHQLPPPYVVKPIMAGSAAEIIVIRGDREPPPGQLLDADWTGGEEVMVERYLPGRTLASAVMGGVALAVTEVLRDPPSVKAGGKSEALRIQMVTPAQISPNIYEKLQKMSLKAHEVIGCRGVTRTNFRFNDLASGDSGLVCLDIDTQPDLTPGALVPEQARYAGHSHAELVAWMVEDASCNR